MSTARDNSTEAVGARAQLRELRRSWRLLRQALWFNQAGACIFVFLLLRFNANGLSATTLGLCGLLFALWLALLWLPLLPFAEACRRRLALNFLHAQAARGAVPSLDLALADTPSLFELQIDRAAEERMKTFVFYAYMRPLVTLQRSYEESCAAAGLRPYPAEQRLQLLVPLLYLVIVLAVMLSPQFQAGASLCVPPLEYAFACGLYLGALLFAQYQLTLQGLLLDRVEQANQG